MRSVLALFLLPSTALSAVVRVPSAAPSTRLPATQLGPAARLSAAFAGPMTLAPAALTPSLPGSVSPVFLPAAAEAPNRLTPAAAAEQLAARLQGTEIILIQAQADANGRRRGYDLSQGIEAYIKASEGRARSLEKDGPAEIFADTYAVEVDAAHKDQVLADLRAMQGADVRSLSELYALGSRKVVHTIPDEAELKAIAARIKDGDLSARWTAFAELASILENASPARIGAISKETRDALVIPLYSIAHDAVNGFNLVQGASRTSLRKSLAEARAADEGWDGVEKGAQEGLKHPGIAGRYLPMRASLTRALEAMDKLDTPDARSSLLRILPHADYAGLEVVKTPGRVERYIREWIHEIDGSIDEMQRGLHAPDPAEGQRSEWHGSQRSGGYQHVEGRRQSSHLYKWRPYRQDPAENKNELLLLLGDRPIGSTLIDPLLATLEFFQLEWPELQAAHRAKTLAREYAGAERNLEYYKKKAEEAGRPYTEEQLADIRRQLREQAEQKYERNDRLDGHSVIDRLLLSFYFHGYYKGSVPGFDEAAYVANAINFFRGATERLEDRSIVAQLADGALGFLTSIADADVLTQNPHLRGQATVLWRELFAKTRALGITLNTRMDGVIDPRPEKRFVAPEPLEAPAADQTVYQVAASPDGAYIAQASGDRRIRVWDARTRKLVNTIELDDARQLYGDLANSLGVSWDGATLLVTTLHDHEDKADKHSYNLIRRFSPNPANPVQTGADALSSVKVRDLYVLRASGKGVDGVFYASPKELRNEQHHYLGAEVALVDHDGKVVETIKDSQLLDLKAGRLLVSAPGRSAPKLELYDVTDPVDPIHITPDWMVQLAADWTRRNPPSEYGWYPTLRAQLGNYQGRRVLLFPDQGKLNIHDLITGELVRSLDIPSDWNISPYATDPTGRYLAAIVAAPGQFSGPNPERLVLWDLRTGELKMDRDTTFVPTGWLYTRGQSIAQLEFSADGRRLIAAGRKGVQVFDLP